MTIEQRLEQVEQQNQQMQLQKQRIQRTNKRLTVALTMMAVTMCEDYIKHQIVSP
jgi:hypothetical protein